MQIVFFNTKDVETYLVQAKKLGKKGYPFEFGEIVRASSVESTTNGIGFLLWNDNNVGDLSFKVEYIGKMIGSGCSVCTDNF